VRWFLSNCWTRTWSKSLLRKLLFCMGPQILLSLWSKNHLWRPSHCSQLPPRHTHLIECQHFQQRQRSRAPATTDSTWGDISIVSRRYKMVSTVLYYFPHTTNDLQHIFQVFKRMGKKQGMHILPLWFNKKRPQTSHVIVSYTATTIDQLGLLFSAQCCTSLYQRGSIADKKDTAFGWSCGERKEYRFLKNRKEIPYAKQLSRKIQVYQKK